MRKFVLLVGAVATLVSASVIIWVATRTDINDDDEYMGGFDCACYPR